MSLPDDIKRLESADLVLARAIDALTARVDQLEEQRANEKAEALP